MKRNTNRKKLPFFIVLFIISFIISYFIDKQAVPLLEYYAKTQGISIVTEKINTVIEKTLKTEENNTVNIVKFEKNSADEIIAVNIDTEKLNRLKAKISSEVIKGLREVGNTPIKIPLGTISGIGIFFGKGPNIKIELIPEGSIKSDIETEFFSSGINQTVHRIYCTINTEFFVMLPDKTISFNVPCKFLLTETVIVGNIPQVYFQNQGA